MILVVDVVNNVVVMGVAEHVCWIQSLLFNSITSSIHQVHKGFIVVPRVWIGNSQGFAVGHIEMYSIHLIKPCQANK